MGLKIGTVTLEEYNSNWNKMFEEEKENLKNIFKDLAIEIEHIGSTSVEGLSAKPIIDIAIGVEKLIDFEKIKDCFQEPYSVKEDSVSDEILIRKRIGADETTHLIHVMEIESKRYQDTIKFRNYIRKHRDVLNEYENLKKELAEEYADNRKMYTSSKNDFIQSIIKKAYEENV
jgi:GrpB-like predicted nucleotidyltransferase (UPF0157 family)